MSNCKKTSLKMREVLYTFYKEYCGLISSEYGLFNTHCYFSHTARSHGAKQKNPIPTISLKHKTTLSRLRKSIFLNQNTRGER